MLARNASHHVASFISLDFLAPRLLCREKATRTGFSNPSKVNVDASSPPSQPCRHSSTTSLGTSPAQLISSLDSRLQDFHRRIPGDITNSQANFFNKAITDLRMATKRKNLGEALRIWVELKKRNLLLVLGPSQLEMYCRLIINVCNREQESPLDASQVKLLEEVTVTTAATGAADGLREYMLACIKRREPDTVVRLYQEYWTLVEQRSHWMDPDTPAGLSGEGGDESEQEIPSSPTPFVRPDILLILVTAHAMRGTFMDALSTVLQTSTFIRPHTISDLARHFKGDRELSQKMQDFARRLDIARSVARPTVLSLRLADLSRDLAISSLERLYRGVIQGLSGPNAWLTIRHSSSPGAIVLPESAWVGFITGFLRCRRTDLAEKLWDDVTRLGMRPTIPMWTALIEGYAELKAYNEALSVWNVMLGQGIKPDPLTYRALIYALYHTNHPEEAFARFQAFLRDLPKMSPPPDERTIQVVYNTTLHGLLFHSREPEARALLEDMRAKGPKPDVVTYNTFLRYYARKEQLKTLAIMLQAMEAAGIAGDVFTFSTVLSALLKVRKDAPQIMLNLMHKQGVKPNTATLTSIVDHQMKTQTRESFQTAMDLLMQMEQNPDAQPNEITYTSILTGIHRGDWLDRRIVEEYRELLWEKMVARRITPKRATYNILIKSCLENPAPEGVQDAMRYYRQMVKQNVLVANDTWYIMIHALLHRNELALANELVTDMERSGFAPAGALSELIEEVRRRSMRTTKARSNSY